MNKIIEYVIGAKDATGNAVKSAISRIRSLAATVGGNLQNIRAGFGMIQTAASKMYSFLQKAFAFERMTVQFKTLTGDMDTAREHMKMLQELGDTPPFSMEQFAAASRALMVMTDGALGFRKSLELVGDAAAATGQPIEGLAHEVGRAYAIIRDGQPLTRATMALRNMGVLTPEVAARLDDLQKSGASTTQIWEEMETALKRYKGAMEETEATGEGLIGAISSQWDDTLREFGAACIETSKDGLGRLLDSLKQLREDGSIAVWADKVGNAFARVGDSIGYVAGLFKGLWKVVKSTIGVAMAFGAGADDAYANGEGLIDQIKAGGRAARQMWNDTWNKQEDPNEKAHEEEVRRQAVERQANDEKKKARRAQEEQEKIRNSLEDGQRKIDERNAKAAAEAYEEEYQKYIEECAREEERMRVETERRIAAERQRLWKEDIDEFQRAYGDAQEQEANAQGMLQAASANEQQAWGWYRDKDSLKAQLDEERANAAAEAQFQKDFEKLKSRRWDWRTANEVGSGEMRALSLDETAVRRVALAREEKAAAEEYARQTAEATQAAADALEQINQAIQEGE